MAGFENIAHLFRPMPAPTSDPWSDRDQLAALGLQPDDKPKQWAEAANKRDRYVAAANILGFWGVWDTRDSEWAVFPQEDWVGDLGKGRAIREAADESEADD